MKYRRVGKAGMKVSEISLGTWWTYGGTVGYGVSRACIAEALNQGINYLDTADIYQWGEAEKVVGQVLKDENHRRSDVVISSKVFFPMSRNVNDQGLSRKHIMESIDTTLTRLQLDYLDIYFAHRFDYNTPLAETILAMDDLIQSGKIHYWGTSQWTAAQIEHAMGLAKELGAHPPQVEQPRYNMLDRFIESEVMETAHRHGMGIAVWAPLAQGILAGKYNKGIPEGSRGATSDWLKSDLTEENLKKVRQLKNLAQERDLTVAQLALVWILRRPEISCAIIGASKPEQITENVQASGVKLEHDFLERVETILLNRPEMPPLYKPAQESDFWNFLEIKYGKNLDRQH